MSKNPSSTEGSAEDQVVIQNKSTKDLIVYLDGKYIYVTAETIRKFGVVADPNGDPEIQAAKTLREHGAIVANMNNNLPAGQFTTLLNLDAVLAGIEATDDV